MPTILKIVLVLNAARAILHAFQRNMVISIVFIGTLSITLMSIIGLNSGRMLIAYGVIIAALMILFFRVKKIRLDWKGKIGLSALFLFTLIFLGSYMYSPATASDYGIWKLRQFLSLAIIPSLIILLSGTMKKSGKNIIENFIIFSAIVTSFIVLYNTFSQSGLGVLQSDWFERQSVGEMNPIWLSRFLGLGLLILQVPRLNNRPWMVLFLSIFLIIASLLTGSKTVLFFTLPIVILYRFMNGGVSKKMLTNFFVIATLVAVILFFLSFIDSNALENRFSLQSGTVDMRYLMYQESLGAFINSSPINQLVGNGGGTIGESLGYGMVREYPHNIVIEILYEVGIVGILVFLIQPTIALFLFLKGFRNWVFFAYVLHLMFAMTSGDLASNDLLFTLFALYLVSEKERNIQTSH